MTAPAQRHPQVIAAEARFRVAITAQGGTVTGEWRGTHTPVSTICPAGHEGTTVPSSVRHGANMCSICGGRERARKQLAAGETKFRARIAELGVQLLGEYMDSKTRVDAICPAGHPCRPRPDHLLQGVGVCAVCSQRDLSAAGDNFRRAVETQGAKILGKYDGAHTRVLVRCAAGHLCRPIPNRVQQGYGICLTCARRDPEVSEARFRRAVEAANAEMLGEYVNAREAVLIRCAKGHLCSPRPDDIKQGQGICQQCWYDWTTFYVLINPRQGWIKFGVTSDDPRPRLKTHRAAGYTDIVRILRELPDAFALERHIIATMRDADIRAVHGREYFDLSALALVLDLVDGWTGNNQLGVGGPGPFVTVAPMPPYPGPKLLSE